jgi:hypothetical protein
MMQLFFPLNGIGRKMVSGTFTFVGKMKNTLAERLQIKFKANLYMRFLICPSVL